MRNATSREAILVGQSQAGENFLLSMPFEDYQLQDRRPGTNVPPEQQNIEEEEENQKVINESNSVEYEIINDFNGGQVQGGPAINPSIPCLPLGRS